MGKHVYNEKKAIELAKDWMRNSVDPINHGFAHATKVEYNALEILKEYKSKGEEWVKEVDEDLVSMASWWHDAFKATFKKGSFLRTVAKDFYEGYESARILRKKLDGLVAPERIEKIAYAVENHNLVWKFRPFVSNKKIVTPLLKIIFEADGIETIEKNRYKHSLQKRKGKLLHTIYSIILHNGLVIFYTFYPFSTFAREEFKKNLKGEGRIPIIK